MTRPRIALLITLTLGLLVVPLAAGAQQATHVYRIGRQHKGHDSGSRAPSCQLLMSIGNKLTTPRRVQAAPRM